MAVFDSSAVTRDNYEQTPPCSAQIKTRSWGTSRNAEGNSSFKPGHILHEVRGCLISRAAARSSPGVWQVSLPGADAAPSFGDCLKHTEESNQERKPPQRKPECNRAAGGWKGRSSTQRGTKSQEGTGCRGSWKLERSRDLAGSRHRTGKESWALSSTDLLPAALLGSFSIPRVPAVLIQLPYPSPRSPATQQVKKILLAIYKTCQGDGKLSQQG